VLDESLTAIVLLLSQIKTFALKSGVDGHRYKASFALFFGLLKQAFTSVFC
jgi:hypothetical protein